MPYLRASDSRGLFEIKAPFLENQDSIWCDFNRVPNELQNNRVLRLVNDEGGDVVKDPKVKSR